MNKNDFILVIGNHTFDALVSIDVTRLAILCDYSACGGERKIRFLYHTQFSLSFGPKDLLVLYGFYQSVVA